MKMCSVAGVIRVMVSLLMVLLVVSVVSLAESGAASDSNTRSGPPKAKVDNVVDTLHGHTIPDPYRWLENSDSPETQQWVKEELAYTRSILDRLPGRAAIHARLEELLAIGTVSAPQIAGRYYLHTRREGTQNQPILYVREGLDGPDRALVDANQMSADGTVALDWWYASHNGKYVAYGTSASGSEMSTLHVVEIAGGTLLPDTIERTRAAGVAWLPDTSGFYYTRYPRKGDVAEGQEMYNRHIFFHKLGDDPAKDRLVFGEGRDPQDWPDPQVSEDGRWLVVTVSQGWTKTEVYLKDLRSDTPFVTVVAGKDFIYGITPYQDKLYVQTNDGASRYRVYVTEAATPEQKNWREIIPESDAVLTNVEVAGGKLLATYEKNASSLLKLFSLAGKPLADVALPTLGSVYGTGTAYDNHNVFYAFQSYTFAPAILHYDLTAGKSNTWVKVPANIDSAAYEVQQVWYSSKDGTKVPMFVVHKKGLQLNGKNPTLLTGYGGFNVSNTPSFTRSTYLWMEHGGVYAVANLRGGAEFGEDWHRAGMLEKKQNVFDDFIAAAEYLIAQKFTDSRHLAIQGGSNGGLLMGAVLTQRPELFQAVVCQVPLLDMLRYQNFQIAKLWVPEYGSAEDAKQFEWLYAYSPYHHVKEGVEYPSVLFMTADSDSRVDPMHAKKMAALMQAKAKNGESKEHPILLRIETKAGHGAGKPVSKFIEEGTDTWSFLFWQLGVTP